MFIEIREIRENKESRDRVEGKVFLGGNMESGKGQLEVGLKFWWYAAC